MTTRVLTSGGFPRRLEALGWKQTVRARGELGGDEPAVAIVGARAATAIGMSRAHAIAKHLASRGVRIVSGGALGIDGAAHRGALTGGGPTTVVLGSGLDVPYPVRHRPLFAEILARGGALVSLVADDAQPRPGMFVGRNPLIAALADAVLVIEADVHSGSLSTARAARTQGRVLAAWPGSRGCDRLLATGAGVLESELDAELAARGQLRQREVAPLDPVATQVRAALLAGCTSVDAIVLHTGLAVRAVLRALPLIESSFPARKQ
ncbi:MAG: DNA-protecting protein DprA [Deltaproteobacteria bacterium]|nr:DNA-protecting protein DprA [Deltaproteobacteria bacterium]